MNTSPSQDHGFASPACDAFELRWNEILDERLDPHADEFLASHAAACESCRRRLRTSNRLLASFGAPPGGDVATALSRQWARRIADQHAAEKQFEKRAEKQADIHVQPAATANATKNKGPRKRRLRPSAWMVLWSTSAAAVAMAVTLQLTLNRRGDFGTGVATTPSGTKASASMMGSTLALGHAAPPDWAEYQRTWQAWESALDPEGTGRESLESSVEPITDSFVPVGQSFSTVLGGLRKTFPTSRIRQPKADDGALFLWERWSVV